DIVPLLPAMLAGELWIKVKAQHNQLNPITHLSYEAPLPEGNTSGSAEDSVQLKELMVLVPKLVNRIGSLEKELKKTKQILGNAVLTLVKKVKTLEKALKRKSKKVIVSRSEGEEPEDQGRIIQDIDDDPLGRLKKKKSVLQSWRQLTLSKVASQSVSKAKSTDKGKRYRRRARYMDKKINTGIEDVNTGSAKVDSVTASKRGQREGKAPMNNKYTEEDWDAIRAKLEANAELTKDVLGKDLPEQYFAKRMVDMLIDTFVPMDFEATKAKLKRYGEELQTKTSKKQKIDDKDVPAIG
ncbi:hypothetical protein Tco_1510486, partial [Tanacetum coccineum]